MNRLATLFLGGALLLSAVAQKRISTGVVTDDMCGASHAATNTIAVERIEAAR